VLELVSQLWLGLGPASAAGKRVGTGKWERKQPQGYPAKGVGCDVLAMSWRRPGVPLSWRVVGCLRGYIDPFSTAAFCCRLIGFLAVNANGA